MTEHPLWPEVPLDAWGETCNTLHLWTQVVGKVRMAATPMVNHWWNVTFFVTSRGLVAPSNYYGDRSFDMVFDFVDHALRIVTSDGRRESLPLKPISVADFYAEFMQRLRRLDIDLRIRTMPCEIENCVRFEEDRTHAQYDAAYVQKFHQALVQANRVMNAFRAHFVGKASPVQFFWGSFDLAATRFSGRAAPPPKGHTPNVADWSMAEAYSHEEWSCGFWPGNGGLGYAAFYVYAYPEPEGYGDTRLKTAAAVYNKEAGQFWLPYDAVRQAADPDALLLDFFQETYVAAADLAHWDRKALERAAQA